MGQDSPRWKAALARLDARVDWERRDRGALRQDLGPVRDLAERLGHPERAFRAVHVAGSKGKGSVAALVAAGLTAAGRRTALYTSPHVEDVKERMVVDGRALPEELLADALEQALDARAAAESEGTPAAAATWFDLLTTAALVAFARSAVEWAVVEVGLGGRLDSTNVLDAELCVITTIELEHAELLGPTRREVALEKAGILFPGTTLVCGPPPGDEAGDAIRDRAGKLGVAIVDPGGPPPGTAGIEGANLALAGAVLEALGESATLLTHAVRRAARLPGRLERRRVGATAVVLDGAHTPASLEGALGALAGDPTLRGRCIAVVGLARDKDAGAFLKTLLGRVDRVHCTSVGGVRHRPAEELRGLAAAAGLDAVAAEPPGVALDDAVAEAGSEGWVLVTGSLWLAGVVRGTTAAPA